MESKKILKIVGLGLSALGLILLLVSFFLKFYQEAHYDGTGTSTIITTTYYYGDMFSSSLVLYLVFLGFAGGSLLSLFSEKKTLALIGDALLLAAIVGSIYSLSPLFITLNKAVENPGTIQVDLYAGVFLLIIAMVCFLAVFVIATLELLLPKKKPAEEPTK